jgi:6-phosphogluconate dehydrogenase (decarboxylating)
MRAGAHLAAYRTSTLIDDLRGCDRSRVAAGFDVLGFTRSRAPMERLAATGGPIAASIADLARESDVVMTVLPDSPDVEAVMLGDDGVFAHARAGALCIDMSTVRPATAVMLNQAALARGLRFIDAPISGGEQGAVDGALSIMAGGSVNDFDAAQPVFRALGTTIVHVVRRVRVKQQRRQTNSSSRARSSWSPRRWCSSRPMTSTLNVLSKRSPAVWPEAGS